MKCVIGGTDCHDEVGITNKDSLFKHFSELLLVETPCHLTVDCLESLQKPPEEKILTCFDEFTSKYHETNQTSPIF